MEHFVNRLDAKSEIALSSALGKNVTVFFPEAFISANSEGVSTTSVSISLGQKAYVVIENDWGDTLKEYHDINYFKASLSDRPKDIVVTDDPASGGWEPQHASVLSTWSDTTIQKITIFEHKDSGDLEAVEFDAALLFQYPKGEFLLSNRAMLPHMILLNHKADIIRNITDLLTVRATLE